MGKIMMAENNTIAGKRINLVRISYMLATWVPIPFWIVIYFLDLLPVLFPSYKGKDMTIPTFFAPAFIAIFAAGITYISQYFISKIEKDRYPRPGGLGQPSMSGLPMNDLLFEHIKEKSYGKFILLVSCWSIQFIGMTARMTIFFGLFIAFKYIRA
jgi:hypothetical protein